ncbi:HEAT repeat-containing protein 1 [Parasteatoda tepidariorum]|uniref:HEAT repeat-containing protein 1 n=1 Tax=Parasteatoda tepidariorum TaxID=114398 RepID=UPI001C719A88|nr:HEAT repeat-containing protein 1 [Parasteatoda tepidariorum]
MSGETALARQLKKLAAPQSSLLLQNRLRKSLLFDPGYAATLDRDIIFAYGVCGIEKLTEINPLFSIYKESLFNNNFCELERSVQTASINKKLDDIIEQFLRMLSPYFLNAASAQALEWLIFRYHIHLYNTDELIACALPHFNTSHFVRVIQIISLEDDKSRWFWLKSVQKSGQPLEYPVILNRFITDGGFKTFVCDLAPNVLKVYEADASVATTVVSFSMQILYDAINKKSKMDDGDLVSYIPYIVNALRSDFNKYTAAAYLVLSSILTKVSIDDKPLTDLLMKVFEKVDEDLLKSAFELLLIAYQYQPVKSMDKKLLFLILSQTKCIDYLLRLAEYDMQPLFGAIIKRSISTIFELCAKNSLSSKFKMLIKFCAKVLNEVKLPEKLVTLLLSLIVQNFFKHIGVKKKMNKDVRKRAKIMIRKIEIQYPENLDKFINKFLSKNDEKICQRFMKLINFSVCGIKSSIVQGSQTSLILGLNHANEDIRKISVGFLIQKAIAQEVDDSHFVKEILQSKLFDDSPSVVLEVLNNTDVLFEYVEKADIISGLSHVLQRLVKKSSPWYPVQMASIDVLCNHFAHEEFSLEVFICLLPFIFPLKKSANEGYLKILNSNYGSKLSPTQRVGLNCSTIYAINAYISSLSTSEKSMFLALLSERCIKTSSYSLYVIYILSAGHAIVSEERLEEISVWIQQLLCLINQLLSHSSLDFDKFDEKSTEEDFVKNISNCLSKEQFPISAIYTTLHGIVKYIKLNFNKHFSMWLPNDGRSPQVLSFKTLMYLFEFCILQMNSKNRLLSEAFHTIFSQLISSQFTSLKEMFAFLSVLWSDIPEKFAAEIQVTSFCMAKSFSQVSFSYSWCFENIPLCLNLMNAVSSPLQVIRDHALSLISLLLQNSEDCVVPLRRLFREIFEHAEEICIDQEQFYGVLSGFFKPACDLVNFEDRSKLSHDLNVKCSILLSFLEVLNCDLTPLIIKYKLLKFFQYLDSVNILTTCIPLMRKFLNILEQTEDETILNIMELLIKKYTPKTALSLKENCKESDVLLECLTFSHGSSNERNIQKFTLNVLSKDFFSSIPSIFIQKKILRTLLDLYATPSGNLAVKKVLTKLCTFVHLILKDFLSDGGLATLKDVKKSRNDVTQGTDWRKLSLLLEIIQNKSKLSKIDQIIPELFAILNKTLSSDNQSSIEYLRQLLLSSIYNCCQQLGSKGLNESQFQVELIVQCIRSSKNPKTHQQSLLLLNLAAMLLPEYVLKNVMSIFTFMGSNLIRQDDSYSFQVISQTIETIVPSLLEASSHQKDADPVQIVGEVIRVFVDSLTDIPQHRQMPLFTKLISTLDPSQFLWLPLGQICDQYATLFHDLLSQDSKSLKLSPTLEFAVNFHKQFTPIVQINTCINLLVFLIQLPDTKEEANENYGHFKEPFNVANHTNEQLQIYKHNVISYINIWLSSNTFITQVSELDSNSQSNLDSKYVVLLEKALTYLQRQSNKNSECNVFPLLVDLVCHVNSMLPPRQFIKALRTLLDHSEPIIKNKAVEILNAKLESHYHHDLSKEENHKYLLKLLKPLLKLFKDLSVEQENNKISQQTILYSLHLLTKIIGSLYPSKFYKVLIVTVNILNSNQSQELTVNALLCLAQLCSSLNVEVLPQLNEFMPAIINMLTDSKALDMSECLIMGIVATLQSLIEHLGSFLSSYMQELVTGICLLSSKCKQAGKKNAYEKFLSLQALLAKEMPLRILLTALDNSYSSLLIICPSSVVSVAHILNEKLRACDYEDVKAGLVSIEKLCLSLLAFRSTQGKKACLTFDSISSVESGIMDVLKTFVMKLSVSLFEKFFKKIFQWVSNVEEDEERKWRLFTFYHLTYELSNCLKNLFVVVAKCFLRHSAALLNSSNCPKDASLYGDGAIFSQLLSNVLDTLNNCFMYDDGHLLDKEHFELLMQPLIDQLENCSDADPERFSKHLCSCIAHFMNAVSDSSLWKKANYQILLKTRHSSARVRFSAIQVVREVVRVMGDSYLVLLPESIPFLAEVMEDESSEVEQECQSVILEMEKILGEPIRKYF